jgi:hypothetical protein
LKRVRTEPKRFAAAVPQDKGDKTIWRPDRGHTGTATRVEPAARSAAAMQHGVPI